MLSNCQKTGCVEQESSSESAFAVSAPAPFFRTTESAPSTICSRVTFALGGIGSSLFCIIYVIYYTLYILSVNPLPEKSFRFFRFFPPPQQPAAAHENAAFAAPCLPRRDLPARRDLPRRDLPRRRELPRRAKSTAPLRTLRLFPRTNTPPRLRGNASGAADRLFFDKGDEPRTVRGGRGRTSPCEKQAERDEQIAARKERVCRTRGAERPITRQARRHGEPDRQNDKGRDQPTKYCMRRHG